MHVWLGGMQKEKVVRVKFEQLYSLSNAAAPLDKGIELPF
jgi:hypothetical protein